MPAEGAAVVALSRMFSYERDARFDPDVTKQVLEFIVKHGTRSVVTPDRIFGCPHEEGID